MRSFKKIAAMVMAVAMLCSFTALAADPEVELNIVEEIDANNPTIELAYTSTASQTTMLVYRGEELEGADVVYINQFAENADPVTLDLAGAETGKYTVVAGGMDVAEADRAVFNYKAVTYAVALTADQTDGLVEYDYTGDLAAVNKDTEITFTLTATKLGYIPSVTVDGTPVSVVAGKFTVKVDGPKTIDVDFVEATATEKYQSFNGAEIHEFAGNPEAEDNADRFDSKLMFGKAIAPAGETVLEAGMYLAKWNGTDWEGYTSQKYVDVAGPYFKADNMTQDGKYGIRFIRFLAGRYQVKSYVKYGDDQYAYGEPVEFVVE